MANSEASPTISRKSLITIRDAVVGDQAFIFSTFLKGLRYGNEYYRQIDKTVYYREYHKLLTSLLIKRQTKVACLKDDPDTILGYAIFQNDVLDWVFVKPTWRKIGIAKDLIPVTVNTVTHLTTVGQAIKPSSWSMNPWRM